jgi:hypothetical protein
MSRSRWKDELEKVRAAHRGRLHPKHVIAVARDPKNPLHGKFEWDDRKASEAYRLQQAAELIRQVTFLPRGAEEPMRSYVSLSTDRLSRSGYRATVDVMNDAQLKAILIEDAKQELSAFQQRYDRLRKVVKFKRVFSAIDQVTA